MKEIKFIIVKNRRGGKVHVGIDSEYMARPFCGADQLRHFGGGMSRTSFYKAGALTVESSANVTCKRCMKWLELETWKGNEDEAER